MNKIQSRVLLIIVMLLCSVFIKAYDFEAINEDGVTIYYNISGDEAIVTYKADSLKSYSGDIVIPETVVHEGNTFKVTTIGERAFLGCDRLLTLEIPNTVTYIGNGACAYCYRLIVIDIPDSVTTIGDGAFLMSGLMAASLGKNVLTIGVGAFAMCPGLTNLEIGDNITTIAENAFQLCSGLPEFTVPNSVTYVGTNAFGGCSSMSNFTIEDGDTNLDFTFLALTRTHISSLYLGRNLVNEINPFYTDKDLFNLTIGDNVTHIDEKAFWFCDNLHTLTIGKKVKSIGEGAFFRCEIKEINLKCTTPPLVGEGVFYKTDKQECTINVPMGSLDKYSRTSPWGRFLKLNEKEME